MYCFKWSVFFFLNYPLCSTFKRVSLSLSARVLGMFIFMCQNLYTLNKSTTTLNFVMSSLFSVARWTHANYQSLWPDCISDCIFGLIIVWRTLHMSHWRLYLLESLGHAKEATWHELFPAICVLCSQSVVERLCKCFKFKWLNFNVHLGCIMYFMF